MSLFLFISYLILFALISNLPLSSLYSLILILLAGIFLARFFVPLLYSFLVSNNLLKIKRSADFKNFLNFSRNVRKENDIYIIGIGTTVFKATLLFLCVYLISFLVSYFLGFINSSIGIKVVVDEIIALISDTNLSVEYVNSALVDLIEVKYVETIRINLGIMIYLASLVCLMYFVFRITRDLNKFYIAKYSNLIKVFHFKKKIYKILNSKKVDYNKGYFSITLPYFIGSILLFSFIYYLLYKYAVNVELILIALTAGLIVLIVLLVFLPVILNYNDLKSTKFLTRFLTEFFIDGNELIKDIEKTKLNDLERKELEDFKNSLINLKNTASELYDLKNKEENKSNNNDNNSNSKEDK